MDEYLRKLEQAAARDSGFIPQLANAYLRGQQLLIPRECHLYTRGLLEGDIFGCLAALQLFSEVLGRSRFEEEEESSSWFFRLSEPIISLDRTKFFNSASSDFYLGGEQFIFPRLDMYGQVPRDGWVNAESAGAWHHLWWRQGRIRNIRRGVRWEGNNGRDTDGSSVLEIFFDWPAGKLPRCRIIYFNPTTEMREALCSLNPRFFQHRPLPLKPPMQEIYLSHRNEQIPLHIRGTLVMPTCAQLHDIYYGRNPNSDPESWLFSVRDVWPVGIRCPGCDSIYSVYKNGDDDGTGAYCDRCQYNLIDSYADDDSHIRAFAHQHATHWLHQQGRTSAIYIPPDCSASIKHLMLSKAEESGELEII